MKKIKKYSYFLNEEIDFKMKPVDYEESNDIILGKKTIVTYLINEFDMKYNYPVYSIGRVDTKKEKFYMYYLHNLNKFKILKGDSDSYQVGVYYLIKK
jgi:3-phenylpropionate/cinnamic acid dioxygenase small subunit